MLRALPASLFAAVALLTAGCPPPGPQPPGTSGAPDASAPPSASWKPKSFEKVTEGCTQSWTCDCGVPAKAGCHLDRTSDTTTSGACAADSGPPTGCTRCLALPPAPACACTNVCP